MLKLFEASRRVSVPIACVRTADQFATMQMLAVEQEKYPLVKWDAANGLTFVNAAGKALLAKKVEANGFDEALIAAQGFPQGPVLFVFNAHRQLHSSEPSSTAAAVQAVANLRDPYKVSFRMVVLLGPMGWTVPQELGQDVVTLTHNLPSKSELRVVIESLEKDAKKAMPTIPALDEAGLQRASDAVTGLSLFAAEQEVALSYGPSGLDQDVLLERKRVIIDQVRGCSVYRGTETFDDLKGLDSVKAKLRARIKAKTPIGVVVWIDEGADVFVNVEHDTSGVKTDQQRLLLVEMENNGWKGAILTGVPGSGKSALARAFGNEAGVLTIALDFGDMEGPHVGESEMMARTAIETIKAVGGGNAFFLLTCNSLQGIRPQFMRRFKKGVYFFDKPTQAECEPIWAYYEQKYALPQQPRPNYTGWTGAEIRECCEEAWDTGCSLVDASTSIIPVTLSRADVIDEMRKGAHGRFLDASKGGTYHYEEESMKPMLRAISIPPAVAVAMAEMKES